MLKRKDMSAQQQSKRTRYGNILRPPVPLLNSRRDTLIFQELELDHYIDQVYPGMPGPRSGLAPIIRMFGVTKSGNSVCCHVHGFSPYFYVNLPDSFSTADLAPFKNKLNDQILKDVKMVNKGEVPEAVLMVELVTGEALLEYTGDFTNFAKITLSLPSFVPVAKRLLWSIIVYQPLHNHTFFCYEGNVDIEMRFMVDKNILGCCWIELPADKWFLRSEETNSPQITSRCQIEVDISWEKLIAHAPKNEWATVAKFRIHGFDIECLGRNDIFPEADMDPVIQISNIVKHHGEENDVITRNIFTLNSCAPIDGAEVFSFENEEAMLEAWAEFVRRVDPDIFTGYNINNFDFPYLINRAKHLKLENFHFLSRLLTVRSNVMHVAMETKNGRRTYKTINIEGRVPYDMMLVTKRDFKLRAYTLNSVCQELLGEQKEDVHYSIISGLQNGNDQTRKRLAVYCLKDADLAVRLFGTSFEKYVKISREAGVTIMTILLKGEDMKILSLLLRQYKSA